MSAFEEYIAEIEERKAQGLHPKPIDDSALLSEIIAQIKDVDHAHREDSLKFFIYNTLPGTTSAAGVKAAFLKDIILGAVEVAEITSEFAFELLSHMKGGPSVEVLLDLALGTDEGIAKSAAAVQAGGVGKGGSSCYCCRRQRSVFSHRLQPPSNAAAAAAGKCGW